MSGRKVRWAGLLLWVVPALWSSNYVIARLAVGSVSPHRLALGRWLLAGLLMLPFAWRGLIDRRDALRREWPHLLALGALGMWICGAFVYQGATSTSATNIALIYAVTPISIVLVSARALRERLSARQHLGVLLAAVGIVFVIAHGDLSTLRAVRFGAGDLWILAAAASWTAYSVLLARWPSSLATAPRLLAIIGGGVVVLVPFTLAEAVLTRTPEVNGRALMLMAAAATLPGVLSYAAYSFLQREMGAARTALMLYLAPIYGAGLGWLVLGERPGWTHVVGAALILPSIALATRRSG